MLFNSLQFFIFFPVVVFLYFVIPDRFKYIWLLAASYYFYMNWNAVYVLLLLTSTVITYTGGLLIDAAEAGKVKKNGKIDKKKTVLITGCVINLGILFVFKYAGYTMELLTLAGEKAHIGINIPVYDIILPVGISFYIFQALGYLIDVYRGDTPVERNFLRYALFVSFFPQLVAGPIERSGNLIRQLREVHRFDYERAREGILLMIWGYFLKIVLADRIAIVVDKIYGDPGTYGGVYLIVATVLFAVQIYCDFAGYSTIAMGAAKVMGIELMDNFNAPFLSRKVSQLWRSWHISLTSWFRDYVYIPLGGSRKGRRRKYLNIFIVFLLSGIWHGANITYVIWGGLNGLYQVIGEILMPVRNRLVRLFSLNRESIGHRTMECIFTFGLFCFSLVFFRADGMTSALRILRSVFTVHNPWILFDGSLYELGLDSKNFHLMLICIAILIFADVLKKKGICIRKVIAGQDYWCRVLVMVAAICFILMFGIWGSGYDAAGFIYFQF